MSATSTDCVFDSLPNELVELILQSTCIVCCSDLRNQFENVFQNLSNVCLRWQHIINKQSFRTSTIKKLIICGNCPLYYQKPRLELKTFEGVSEAVPFQSLDGEYYVPGAPMGVSGVTPYVCRHFVEEDQQEPSAPRIYIHRSECCEEETRSARIFQPTASYAARAFIGCRQSCHRLPPELSSVRREFIVTSQHWCRYKKYLYIGYYSAIDVFDPAARFICVRLSRDAQKDSSRLPGKDHPWPIRSNDVAAWMLPSHPTEEATIISDGCYQFRVSHRTGNVVVFDNLNRRLIIYDDNGHPLGVVLMPKEVNESLRRALEIVTCPDNMQYIVQYGSDSDRLHICRVAIDRSTRSVCSDVDSCPQYEGKVMARYDDQQKNTHFSILADVDDDGLVILVMGTHGLNEINKISILRPSDLRRIGSTITLPFNEFFIYCHLDSSRGQFNFSIRDPSQKADLYCCDFHPTKL